MLCSVSRRAGADGDVVLLTNLSSNDTWLKPRREKPRKLAKNQEGELKPGDSFSLLMPPHAVEKKFGRQAVAFELLAAPGTSSAALSATTAGGAPAPFKVPAPKVKEAQRTLRRAYEVSSQELGSGQFAKVFLCRSRQDGKEYACKNVQKKKFLYTQPKFEQNIKKEISILQGIKHPNIVQVVDVFDTDDELNLIMELMTGGELFDYIIESGRLEEEVSRGIVEQVLQAVKHLHAENILHRDREPDLPRCFAHVYERACVIL